jgi:hypothetical protein
MRDRKTPHGTNPLPVCSSHLGLRDPSGNAIRILQPAKAASEAKA